MDRAGRPARCCGAIEAERIGVAVPRPDRVGARCPTTRTSPRATCQPAQGVLRRLDHAGPDAAAAAASACPDVGFYNCFGQSEIGPLATVLRPEEHAERPDSVRPPGAVRRDAGGRRRTANDVEPGGTGEVVYRSPQLCDGLLGQARGDRRGLRRRLVPLRRPGPHRRRGLPHRGRPDQGRHQHRRRAGGLPRGGGRALHPPGGGRGGGDRRPPTSGGSRRSPRSSCCARAGREAATAAS